MVRKNESFALQPFLYDLVFHQIHPMNKYFHREGHVFVVQKIWNQLYDVMPSFLFLLKNKCSLKFDIVNLHDSK